MTAIKEEACHPVVIQPRLHGGGVVLSLSLPYPVARLHVAVTFCGTDRPIGVHDTGAGQFLNSLKNIFTRPNGLK